jgi:hypothetical protein
VAGQLSFPDDAIEVVEVTFALKELNPPSFCCSDEHWKGSVHSLLSCLYGAGARGSAWRKPLAQGIALYFRKRKDHLPKGLVHLLTKSFSVALMLVLSPAQELPCPAIPQSPQLL